MEITKKTPAKKILTKMALLSTTYISAGILALIMVSSAQSLEPNKQAIEVGLVNWQRDFDKSLIRSKQENKPVLALFQEVPGCHGCKKFGEEVLSNKKLVKRIEDNFIPVLIYNNRGGKDSELLKRYQEPSWNYQVIRFLDHNGKDIIPRRDKIWTLGETNTRIDNALEVFNSKKLSQNNSRQVFQQPRIQLAQYNLEQTNQQPTIQLAQLSSQISSEGITPKSKELKQIAFSQHCFWTGEMKLGGLDGVKKTEAGFYDGREVTRVWFDSNKISEETLNKKARSFGVADRAYEVDSRFTSSYRKAPESDQKRQLRGTGVNAKDLNDFQATKVNAFIRQDRARALKYLKN